MLSLLRYDHIHVAVEAVDGHRTASGKLNEGWGILSGIVTNWSKGPSPRRGLDRLVVSGVTHVDIRLAIGM